MKSECNSYLPIFFVVHGRRGVRLRLREKTEPLLAEPPLAREIQEPQLGVMRPATSACRLRSCLDKGDRRLDNNLIVEGFSSLVGLSVLLSLVAATPRETKIKRNPLAQLSA